MNTAVKNIFLNATDIHFANKHVSISRIKTYLCTNVLFIDNISCFICNKYFKTQMNQFYTQTSFVHNKYIINGQ